MTLSVFVRKDLEEKLVKVSKIHPFYLFYLTVYLLNEYKQILVILFDLKIYLFFKVFYLSSITKFVIRKENTLIWHE